MGEIPKDILSGGHEDNEWESLNEQDEFNAEYGAEMNDIDAELAEKKRHDRKVNLGKVATGDMPKKDGHLGEVADEEDANMDAESAEKNS